MTTFCPPGNLENCANCSWTEQALRSRGCCIRWCARFACPRSLAGHELHTLRQRATAIVHCRIFPGNNFEPSAAALVAAIGDSQAKIERPAKDTPIAKAPPFDARVVGPIKTLSAALSPADSYLLWHNTSFRRTAGSFHVPAPARASPHSDRAH